MVREIASPPAVQEEQPRTLEQLAVEINYIKVSTCINYWEMGRRLKEAKKQLPHGQWGQWLRENVDFSQKAAGRLIAIADAFPNWTALSNLNYTQIWMLATAPEEIREDILSLPQHVDGEVKQVEDMTSRELEQLIKEKKAAQEEARAAQEEAKTALAEKARLQNKNTALLAQVEAARKEVDFAREEGRQEERQRLQSSTLKVGTDSRLVEKTLRREVQGLMDHLKGSGDSIVDSVRSLGTQTGSDLAFNLAKSLEDWAETIRQTAVAARNHVLLMDEPEDFD